MELVLTGINPPESFIAAADYITRMTCIRHPFEKGIDARRGIEY
jgi:cob(I)alamin adenosyltransferase